MFRRALKRFLPKCLRKQTEKDGEPTLGQASNRNIPAKPMNVSVYFEETTTIQSSKEVAAVTENEQSCDQSAQSTDSAFVGDKAIEENIPVSLHRLDDQEDDEEVSYSTVTFNNNLPYHIRLEVQANRSGMMGQIEEQLIVSAGQQATFTARQDSVLTLHLVYLKQRWTYSERVDSIWYERMCEFRSLDTDQVVRLGKTYESNQRMGRMTFTVFTSYWLTNQTNSDLVFLEQCGDSRMRQYIKTRPTDRGPNASPILLNNDIVDLCVAETDEHNRKENWTWVPLDQSANLNLVTYGIPHHIYSDVNCREPMARIISFFEVDDSRIQPQYSSSQLTNGYNNQTTDDCWDDGNQNFSPVSPVMDPCLQANAQEEVDNCQVTFFTNNLDWEVMLKIKMDDRVYIDTLVQSKCFEVCAAPVSADLVLAFFHDQEAWIFKTSVGNFLQLDVCEFISLAGYRMHIGCTTQFNPQDSYQCAILGPVELVDF